MREANWNTNRSADNDVHCVLRISDYAVFRVSGSTESDARSIADWQTAKFIENLIDEGLDPEPVEEEEKIHFETDPDASVDVVPSVDWSCLIRTQEVVDPQTFHEFRVEGTWSVRNNIPSEQSFPLKDIVMSQRSRIPMIHMENDLSNLHPSALSFFSLESTYEQRKFQKEVAAYGNKARSKSHALVFDVTPASEYEVYLLPPGSSINSAHDNLYWPAKRLPRELSDRRKIYGFLKPKHL